MGKKKRPFYRIVAAESRRARDGRFLEVLGTYNPIEVPAVVTVKEERLSHWLNEGAEPSDTVVPCSPRSASPTSIAREKPART